MLQINECKLARAELLRMSCKAAGASCAIARNEAARQREDSGGSCARMRLLCSVVQVDELKLSSLVNWAAVELQCSQRVLQLHDNAVT